MKRLFYLSMVCGIFLTSCQNQTKSTNEEETTVETEEVATPTTSLVKLWETEPLLTTSESVVYDKANDVFYVSCIGSDQPWENDGTGFIAKVAADGSIISQKWVSGLNAPKGLGLIGTTLYANDNDQLVAIDINSAEVIKSMSIEDASSLNDIAVGVNEELYLSNSNTNTIYKVVGDEVTSFYQDSLIGRVNGIWAESDRLLVAGFEKGRLSTLSLDEKVLTQVGEDGMIGADGIVHNDAGYFVSSWHGEIYHFDKDWNRSMVLNTRGDSVNAADIEIVADKNLILVPTFFDNRVMAYEIK